MENISLLTTPIGLRRGDGTIQTWLYIFRLFLPLNLKKEREQFALPSLPSVYGPRIDVIAADDTTGTHHVIFFQGPFFSCR